MSAGGGGLCAAFNSAGNGRTGGRSGFFKKFDRLAGGTAEFGIRGVVGDQIDFCAVTFGEKSEGFSLCGRIVDTGKESVFQCIQPAGTVAAKVGGGKNF